MSEKFKVGLVQNSAQADMQATLDRAEELVREAAAKGAALILTPEFFACYSIDDGGIHTAPFEESEHPALPRFGALAKELGVWLVLGSLAIKQSDKKAANRTYVLDPQGRTVATYDKIHLFDVDIDTQNTFRESDTLEPGDHATLVDTPWGGMGLTVCYDLRFPHLFRDLAKAGASFLTCPAAFMKKTGEAHWHVLLRARAIECGAFVFAACQSGAHGRAKTYGHSLVVAPWGEIIAEADSSDEEAVVIAEIDPGEVKAARARIPALRHDRPYDAPAAARSRAAE